MAFDKVIDSAQLDGALEATANKIREKTGETGSIPWDADNGFAIVIESLEVGGGEIPTPTITVSADGLITATAGDKSATLPLDTQPAKTVTPSSSSQTAVEEGRYTTGAVTVAEVPTETKTVTPSKSQQSVTPTSGKYFSKVTVKAIPTSYVQPTGTLDITSNNTYDVKQYASVNVNVAGGGGGNVTYFEMYGESIAPCSTYAVFRLGGRYMKNNDFFDASFSFIVWLDAKNGAIEIGSNPPYEKPRKTFSGSYVFEEETGGYVRLSLSGGYLSVVSTNTSKCELQYAEGFAI